jgi:two-component system chemotaxis response regulator CheY
VDDIKKVIVADDSIVMRNMIRDILNTNGFDVIGEAKNGKEVLELYRQHKPHLVTLDIVMPHEHGIDALRKILEFDPDARVVVVSALNQKALLLEAINAGARDYVIKPFDKEELLEAAKRSVK